MSLTRQEIRSQSRQYDKAVAKLEKLEATTERLVKRGIMKRRKKTLKDFFMGLFK